MRSLPKRRLVFSRLHFGIFQGHTAPELGVVVAAESGAEVFSALPPTVLLTQKMQKK